jgi:hypothetical protein
MSPTALRYEPYEQTVEQPNVVVDGSPNAGTVVTLTHWPGYPCPPDTQADLSAQMAFRYLDLGADLHGAAEVVTNNHFDQDGLVAVFTLSRPDDALARRAFLEDLAAAGDFATYSSRDAARLSMVIHAYADPDRSPLGGLPEDSDEVLYRELLGRLAELADHPEKERALWEDEDRQLTESEAALASGAVTITEHPEVDLAVVAFTDPEPHWSGHRFGHQHFEDIHPMAVNNATDRFALLVVRGRRFRFTYRYETWVQYRSRRPKARVDLAPLAEELTAAEPGGAKWFAEPPGGLAPVLGLAEGDESGLEPDDVVSRLTRHLETAPVAWDPYAVD